MRRALSAIAIAAIATAAALVPIQVAAAERDEAQLTRLAMIDAMRDQLAAMGVNPALAVVQTGIRNYAGPNCPGADWNCTDGTIAIQLGIANQFECTGDLAPGDDCTIVQSVPPTSPSGNNYARCFMHSSGPIQSCTIDQTNFGTGNNYAYVEMVLVEDVGAIQNATQNAIVNQENSGSLNHSHISQTIQQIVRERKKEGNTFVQTQNATQNVDVCQAGLGGCPGASAAFPTPGSNHSSLHQLVSQDAFANVEAGESEPETDQTQISNIFDDVDQASEGRSHSEANVSDHQVMHAQFPGNQFQDGPVRCCATQTGSEDSTASINESSHQQSDGGVQMLSLTGTCFTSGNCTLSQTAANDSAHTSHHESDTFIATETSCESGGESTGSCQTQNVD